MSTVPPFAGNISFHAQHSPMGAFFSFTCGHFGSRGGFGLQIGKPGNQNLYIGVKDGDRFSDAPLKCLPFYEGADADEAARFDVEKKAGEKKPGIVAYRREEIQRHYGWATDKWVTPDFEFAIYTPFWDIRDPSIAGHDAGRLDLTPSVSATLRVDNRNGTRPKTAVFAIRWGETGARVLRPLKYSDDVQGIKGFALRDRFGVRGLVSDETHREKTRELTRTSMRLRLEGDGKGSEAIQEQIDLLKVDHEKGLDAVQGFNLEQALVNPLPHLLGGCTGLTMTVPAGRVYVLEMSLAAFLSDVVTTGLEGRYRYTRSFSSLDDALEKGMWAYALRDEAEKADKQLVKSNLSPDQQFLIAHATRSYYGSTQLLDVGGQPFWIVNEGEYCMMNTLDLSVDQVFWELKQNPWVVKNLLDNFVRHYSYVDQHGLSFCHDMGVHNQFSPFGHSSYELPNLNAACFSYMTCEELCNWILIAACYVAKTKDLDWLRLNEHVIEACLGSLTNRCDPKTGFPIHDSSRCGEGGAEITTYDSLDHSLAQTRNNLYMIVKVWAASRGLGLMLEQLAGNQHPMRIGVGYHLANLIERELPKHAGPDGVFPAVFESDNTGFASRILPACEGLMYPLYWDRLLSRQPQRPEVESVEFVAALKKHTVALLKSGTNLFPDGGIKLSSTSNNSWMSKIAIFQHVCRRVFKLDEDSQIRDLFAKADAAHVKWMTEGESAYWACSDQFVSGVAKGSKYYPRIITTALWLDE